MHPIAPEELMAYLDGELMPKRASEAAQHLAHCEECQTAAADMQSVSRRLLEWEIEEVSVVLPTVRGMAPREIARPWWMRRVTWAAGAAAAIVGLVSLVAPVGQRLEMAKTRTPKQGFGGILGVTPLIAPQLRVGEPVSQLVAPLLIRTAEITLSTPEFVKTRAALDDILKRYGGHIASLTVGSPADSGQTLQATLRVPSARLDAALAEIRGLGRVESEQQGGEEVTQQMIDLEARLTNSRNTEQRLTDILRRSTGKIADVLAVEKEIDRVRGEIERMEAERKDLGDRVLFASVSVRINEEYRARLVGSDSSASGRLRNAAVDGYRNVADTLTSVALLGLSYGPVLLLWAAVLFFPVRYAWRWSRRRVR